MKKILLTMTMMMICTSIYAQYTLDVTVERKKDYSEYGAKYQPLDMSGMKTTAPDIPRSSISSSSLFSDPFPTRSNTESVKVVSDEIQLLNGTKLGTNTTFPIRARVVTKSNGKVEITCMGIKKGQSWQPCSKPIISLQQKYNSAASESEKSMILDLMDWGNYLLDAGDEMYIIK